LRNRLRTLEDAAARTALTRSAGLIAHGSAASGGEDVTLRAWGQSRQKSVQRFTDTESGNSAEVLGQNPQ